MCDKVKMTNASQNPVGTIPLCVDLDGTLLKTDMLFEQTLIAIKAKPWLVFLLPIWLMQGKAYLKHMLAQRCQNCIPALPFNQDVLNFLYAQQGKRLLVLVTGTYQPIAEEAVKELNLFDRIIGSTLQINLTGEAKRKLLVDEFGEKSFDYIGNDSNDIPVWMSARDALAVSSPTGIIENCEIQFSNKFLLSAAPIKNALKLMRVHQWSKNILVFVPFLLNPGFGNAEDLLYVSIAFLAMSLLASLTYIVNDMLDLDADRRNTFKSNRPLASGSISLAIVGKLSIFASILLLICLLVLPMAFNLLLFGYLVITLFYSFYLKQYPIVDVCTIAALLTMRVIGGIIVINAEWSFWLLAFSMFLFFSLAMAKRVSELINLRNEGRTQAIGRGYDVRDTGILMNLGITSGFISILVVALYVNGAKVITNYSNPMLLWLVCPILMYWIGRLWLICDRGKLVEDPIEFALRDRVSIFSMAILATVLVLAKIA